MTGLIVHNAYYRSPAYLYQAVRIQEELAAMGVKVDIREDNLSLAVDAESISTPFADYDFCIFWDKDLYLLQALQASGVRVFNRPEAVRICDDKMLTYLALAKRGIPILKTLACPLRFDEGKEENPAFLQAAENQLHYPMVAKQAVGSLGEGVYLASDRTELEKAIATLRPKRYLLQEYVASSYGTDVRVLVLGDTVLGAIRRTGEGFCSNVAQGGKAETFALDDKTTSLCLTVAKTLQLDYCGIDLLLGTDGSPIVCEVNSNAFFETFERTTGINVAHKIAQYVWGKMNQHQ